MMKKLLIFVLIAFFAATSVFGALLFLPKQHKGTFRLKVEKGQGIAAVSRHLADNDIVHSRLALSAGAYLMGIQNKLHQGNYKLPNEVSAWQILRRLKNGRPDTVSVRIIEGMRFAQMRRIINQAEDIRHDTLKMSDAALLKAVDAAVPHTHPEGLFAPDSYEIDAGASDLDIFKLAYKNQQKYLERAWNSRDKDLTYKNPYELLIMASIIEKETAHADDRGKVASVFANRLKKGMRLQTDPTVIYGMGERYQGKIRKADLRRDTPYNTYTRDGLPPTPIALPGKAALEAAAEPDNTDYFYFVSKMDSSGESHFSRNLDEHNAAVRKYILKK
ncbi:MAG: endolytic transglycosylase MltG [Neisseria sp.]|nr:endolytic transglycosylase MltG [Neisseria sp.]